MKTFHLAGARHQIQCFALHDYHRYWENQTERIKNPKFDAACDRILSLKNPTNYRYKSAVSTYSTEVVKAIEELDLDGIEIVVVPSCRASSVSAGLDSIAKDAAAKLPTVYYRSQSLHRTRTIDKLSRGGNRSLIVHRDSLAFRTAPVRLNGVLILDDVCTTGNSVIAAADKVFDGYAAAYNRYQPPITVLVLGRTVHD